MTMRMRMCVSVCVGHSCPLKQIQNGKEENPHEIDEVPEQARYFYTVGETLGLGAPEFSARPPEKRDDDRATKHVQGVERGEREINTKISAVLRHECGQTLNIGRG